MITAKIVLDSVNKYGNRITTFELTLPKSLLAQLNTHRVLSKNAASSRAIPTKKIIESVTENPVMPVWTINRPGMTGEIADDETKKLADDIWLETRDFVLAQAKRLSDLKLHKQNVNRLLEPFLYAKVVCTATDLDWFFKLRISDSAQEEIAILARAMQDARNNSAPKNLLDGEWHIPYILDSERELDLSTRLAISVARCARVSYKTHDDELISTIEKDLKLFNQLFEEKHLSPFEHSAKADSLGKRYANFNGWIQYRKYVEDSKSV